MEARRDSTKTEDSPDTYDWKSEWDLQRVKNILVSPLVLKRIVVPRSCHKNISSLQKWRMMFFFEVELWVLDRFLSIR